MDIHESPEIDLPNILSSCSSCCWHDFSHCCHVGAFRHEALGLLLKQMWCFQESATFDSSYQLRNSHRHTRFRSYAR